MHVPTRSIRTHRQTQKPDRQTDKTSTWLLFKTHHEQDAAENDKRSTYGLCYSKGVASQTQPERHLVTYVDSPLNYLLQEGLLLYRLKQRYGLRSRISGSTITDK